MYKNKYSSDMKEEIDNILEGFHLNEYDLLEVRKKLLDLFSVSYRRKLLKVFMKHIEKDGAISFRDYDYSIKNFEEENKSLL